MRIVNVTLIVAAVVLSLITTFVSAQGSWKVVGNTGVAAMHAILVAPDRVLIIDKAESSDATLPDGSIGWSCEYHLDTNTYRVLPLTTNTFCSAGAFLGNGTFMSTAGSTPVLQDKINAQSGFSGIRLFQPCQDDSCSWTELPTPLSSFRWYNAMVTLPDGRTMNLGGSKVATGANSAGKNNPTYEIYSSSGTSNAFPIQFLVDTLPFNLYPCVQVIADGFYQGYLFIFANKKSVIYDIGQNQVIKALPDIPGASRSYPLTGSCALLPLTYENNYNPEAIICGGQTVQSYTSPADNTCGRINLGDQDPAWDMDDFGGQGRIMGDSVALPDGTLVFVNGAATGIAGYFEGGHYLQSDPVLFPVAYNMNAPKGQRWTRYAATTIPRLYHSVAMLIPDGTIWVAGSNPNPNPRQNVQFITEYRAEVFTPPYIDASKPRITITSFNSSAINKAPINVKYSAEYQVTFTIAGGQPGTITSSLIHTGFKTHSQAMSMRCVKLLVDKVTANADGSYTTNVWMPPNAFVTPPGPQYVFLLNDGQPAASAVHVLIG
ncbi:10189_t:CDS:2 [Paraglomus brasilianum]|uniref:10189_t:CDS:1 n=1 Tax=Paraglomus brasilianum TaxID=144538 RepID=A0A9N9FVJ1_9GLOM|nr:10189_t:CDS:2 [Paraglomus brasilianum]